MQSTNVAKEEFERELEKYKDKPIVNELIECLNSPLNITPIEIKTTLIQAFGAKINSKAIKKISRQNNYKNLSKRAVEELANLSDSEINIVLRSVFYSSECSVDIAKEAIYALERIGTKDAFIEVFCHANQFYAGEYVDQDTLDQISTRDEFIDAFLQETEAPEEVEIDGEFLLRVERDILSKIVPSEVSDAFIGIYYVTSPFSFDFNFPNQRLTKAKEKELLTKYKKLLINNKVIDEIIDALLDSDNYLHWCNAIYIAIYLDKEKHQERIDKLIEERSEYISKPRLIELRKNSRKN